LLEDRKAGSPGGILSDSREAGPAEKRKEVGGGETQNSEARVGHYRSNLDIARPSTDVRGRRSKAAENALREENYEMNAKGVNKKPCKRNWFWFWRVCGKRNEFAL